MNIHDIFSPRRAVPQTVMGGKDSTILFEICTELSRNKDFGQSPSYRNDRQYHMLISLAQWKTRDKATRLGTLGRSETPLT